MFAPPVGKRAKTTSSAATTHAPKTGYYIPRGPTGDLVEEASLLQRAIGNQATLRLLAQRSSRPSGIGLGDQHEQAGPTMRMPEPQLLRGCARRAGGATRHIEQAGSPVPAIARDVLRSPGRPLDAASRAFFEPRFGHDFSQVRVHTDAKAAESARAVNALAYTVGRDVVFGHGQFAPHSVAGQRLLAHELAHTVQQRGAILPSLERLEVSAPDDHHERQAEYVAQSVVQASGSRANDGDENPEALLAAGSVRAARMQRVISFTTADGAFASTNVVANEDAAGFTLGSPVPTFQWTPDVTIHGDAGDVFADWEVAHHQVGKGDWLNVWWGTGADRTHRHQTVTGGLPIRDATAAGNTWYSDWRAQGFAADGDVRSPVMRDTPSERIPWANPIAGRGGTRGWFNFGLGFVSTLSARHIPDGTGAAAFRHLSHVHWNFSVDGTFDTTLPVPGRVTLNGGTINMSGVIPGIDTANRPMHGGPVFADNLVNTDT
jgi:Domain of unknown function (DUF4157)